MSSSGARPAKDRFSSVDALALARELRSLEHPRVDKVFDAGPDGWAISFRLRGAGHRDLVVYPGSYGAVAPSVVDHGDTPGPFARELRRLLAGTILGGVLDPGGDRILDAEFSRSDGSATLRVVVEFFGSGNFLVVRDGVLVAVSRPRNWAHRSVRVGEPFVPAPASPNPWEASSAQIEILLLGSDADRVSTLAARAGFSGPVAEELLQRVGIDPRAPARLEAGTVAAAVRGAATGLLSEIGEPPAGYLYRRGEEIVDATPYPSRRRREAGDLVEERVDSFGAALGRFYAGRPAATPTTAAPVDPSAGLRRQRARQAEAVDRLSAEAGTKTAQANRIFEQYGDAEKARVRASEEKGPGEVVRVRLGDLEVPLSTNGSLETSARALYDEAKKAKTKLSGAREALAETDRRLESAVGSTPVEAARATPVDPPRKPLWFERFRWFVSSEGILVIAGRDAASNDLVVRRYLRAGDRYVHADLHGAASVVVKVSGTVGAPTPGEPTLTEAGQFAAAHSKAWRAGHASADAFWVLPEQVSKSGASGEFVARGAWVIHGTKHPLRDLPLELALGRIDHDGHSLWTVGPPSAVRTRGTVLAYLSPDDERGRIDRERELSLEFGIDRDLVQRLLPPGGLRIRRA